MIIESIEQALATLPIAQYEWFRTEDLTFSERVRTICQTQCPRYGKSWACPPAVGTVEECRRKCLSYPNGLLIATLHEVDDSSDMVQTLATRVPHEELTHQVAKLLKASSAEIYALSGDSCSICDTCTFPNAPCAHPEQMLPCVESHGILVTELMESHGISFQFSGNVVTWISLILFRKEDL
ncbi:MAG: DUF2284 domain-containing protein [Ruminococcaceae bacterium]|nr:DUF2284 domain-containing protein [Oscillospiraceae bacterium]